MKIESIPALTEFEFNGIKYKIEKFKNFNLIRLFRQSALPILASHFEPIERLVTASTNEFLVDWELLTVAVGAELRIDRYLIPAFQVILKSQGINMPDGAVEAGISDITYLYAIIYAQIKEERLLEHFIARKLSLWEDVKEVLDTPIDLAKAFDNKKLAEMFSKLKGVVA